MTQTTLTLPQLFDQLIQEGEIEAAQVADEAAILQQLNADPHESDSPWFVKLMVGFSAWLAALILGTFFGLAGLINSPESMLLWGAILCPAAVILKRSAMSSIFLGQLAFAASLVGQGLLIVGIGSWVENVTLTLLCVIGLELLLFFLYPDLLHRLISVLAVCVALLGLLYNWEWMDAVHLFTVVFAVGALLVWLETERFLSGRFAPLHAPLGYGLVLALFALMLLKLANVFELFDLSRWWLSSLGLAAVLLYLGLWTLNKLDFSLLSLPTVSMIAALVLLSIPIYETPGILAALIVLNLGFWCNNRLLLGLATIFLLFFLGTYYYYLDVTLLNKSYILMGSGGVLLLLWAVFRQLNAREVAL